MVAKSHLHYLAEAYEADEQATMQSASKHDTVPGAVTAPFVLPMITPGTINDEGRANYIFRRFGKRILVI